MRQFLRLRTHWQVARDSTTERSSPRGCRKSISSTATSWRSAALFIRPAINRFWRNIASRSTSMPSLSSNVRSAYSFDWRCSCSACNMPMNLRAANLSSVGCSSIVFLPCSLLAKVVGSADVFVGDGRFLSVWRWERDLVQPVFENGPHAVVGGHIGEYRSPCRRFHAFRTVFLSQTQDALTGTVDLLLNIPACEYRHDKLLCVWAMLARFRKKLLRLPFHALVLRRHVIFNSSETVVAM